MSGGSGLDRPISVLVADDEALARRRIVELLEGRESTRLVGQRGTGPATLEAVRELEPDLLFLDVQMPGLSGFEVLACLPANDRPIVIFSTAYDEYALEAFEVHAVDYLLKPFADERFEESLQLAVRALRSRRADELHDRIRGLLAEVVGAGGEGSEEGSSSGYIRRFVVPERDRQVVISAESVDWIEASGDYIILHADGDHHLLRGTMTALEERLDPERFVRIHRSTIVQLDRVEELRSDEHGDYDVILRGGRRLRVSRTYREGALTRLGVSW